MPRTEEANQRLREAQREKILESARKVFARKGLATTMADVAAAAEVSQGLAYRYFASKEALFHALAMQAMQTSQTILQDVSGTPGERLTRLLSIMMDARRAQPEMFQLLNQVQSSGEAFDDLHALVHERSQNFFTLLRQLIVQGQTTGEVVAGDPDQLVIAIVSCLEGLSRFALYDYEQFKQHCPDASIILRMILVHPVST